jgi:serine/threonine protein kinase
MNPRRGELLLRRYRVLEPVTETALWQSYRAQDEQGHGGAGEADVLVKYVRPELAHDEPSRTYVVRELLKVRVLQHPAIVRPIDVQVSEEDGAVVLVEAAQAGLSQGVLLSRMATYRHREGERFTQEEVRRMGVQLALALSYVHGQLLCHGDLRLESVLIKPEGIRLCDVGLGRALPRGPYLEAVGRGGEAELLAPEVRTGRPPDVRSDVYSMAAIYRYLICAGDLSVWDAFTQEKPMFAGVLARALLEDPQLRYPTVEGMVADIESVALTGAPLRRRHSPTPLAMAVAAGRLPMEELDRPVEELIPEGRRRKDSVELRTTGAVLAPLSNSPSARVSLGTIPPQVSPEAPQAIPGPSRSGGTPVAPMPSARSGGASVKSEATRAARKKQDVDHVPTRPVRKADVEELHKSASSPSLSTRDIGAQHTVPFERLDPAEAAPGPKQAPDRGQGRALETDFTEEQERLDPAELKRLVSAPPRMPRSVPLPGPESVDASDLLTREQVRLSGAEIGLAEAPAGPAGPARGGAGEELVTGSSAVLSFRELPPLMPAPAAPPPRPRAPSVERMPAVGSGPAVQAPQAIQGLQGSGPKASGKMAATTKPIPIQKDRHAATTRQVQMPSGRLMVFGALALSAVIGALAAWLVVSLYPNRNKQRGKAPEPVQKMPAPAAERQKDPAPAPVPAPAPKAPAPAPAPTPAPAPAPAPKAPAPAQAQAPAPAGGAASAPAGAGGCPAGMVPVSGRAPFCVDQHEQPGAGQRPQTDLTLAQAEAACKARGARLCSEAEWEQACRGRDRASYPYGHDVRLPICNVKGGALLPAGSKERCVSPAGTFDMSGNAAEWVAGGGVRGGSAAGESDGRCSVRLRPPPAGRGPFLGYRCCK